MKTALSDKTNRHPYVIEVGRVVGRIESGNEGRDGETDGGEINVLEEWMRLNLVIT